MFFVGCSNESIDNINESIDNSVFERSAIKQRPFKVKGAGSFYAVPPTACENLVQIFIDGEGTGSHVGRFEVEITYCTDFQLINLITGTMTAANGDKLYFTSDTSGVDENGSYSDYIFNGGSGRFEFVTGEFRLYGIQNFDSPTSGTYTNSGSGFLSY